METVQYTMSVAGLAAFALLFRTHFAHAIFGAQCCSRRTDTRNTLIFRQEQKQLEEVIFDFSRLDPRSFDVTIPVESQWVNLPTFHLHESSGITLVTLDGWTSLFWRSVYRGSGTVRAGKDFEHRQRPLEYLVWRRAARQVPGSRSVVRIFDSVQFWRTQCSVIQDSERYFSLCTTPAWIRILFATVCYIPGSGGTALRDAMIKAALYIQLRLIYHKNDNLTYQGYIYIDWLWWTTPQWVTEFQGRSAIAISRTVLSLCYWVGRLFLGMRDTYEEYDVVLEFVGKEVKCDTVF